MRFLSGQPDNVEAIVAEIERILRTYAYSPTPIAQGLAGRHPYNGHVVGQL